MSRRGNYHDRAVAERFFQLLKRERIRRKAYETRDKASQDIFDHIEMFYKAKRRHSFNERLSPVEFETQYFSRLALAINTALCHLLLQTPGTFSRRLALPREQAQA